MSHSRQRRDHLRHTGVKQLQMVIVWDALNAAIDAHDEAVCVACRRLIGANALGYLQSSDARADWRLVHAFAEGSA